MISGMFLDVNHFPGIVQSSNLLLKHLTTSVDVVEGLEVALRNKSRNKSLPGRPGNHDFSSKSCFFGTFLDVNHFPGIVKSSNLFLRHPNTSVDVVEGLKEARSCK